MKIFKIYNSIDGEVNRWGQGCFTTFIRFAGCNFGGDNIHCSYCDTKYSQEEDSGVEMTIPQILICVQELGCHKVTITGGEPFAQGCEDLVDGLIHMGCEVSIETNGSYYIGDVNCKANIIMDWKLSNSGIPVQYMIPDHFTVLAADDYVKFVIDNEVSYKEAVAVMRMLQDLGCVARFAFSPMWGVLDPKDLFMWLQRDKLFDCVINLQLHKIIWPNIVEGEEH